jgi:XTP/dITP diphosphohydrolase
MRLLLATNNRGKLVELRRILGCQLFEVVGLDEFGAVPQVEETGATYAENAVLKARHYYHALGLPAVGDDSGLEVEALGGEPGVHSARFAGSDASDSERMRMVIEEMRRTPGASQKARYVCAAAIVWKGGERVFRGEVSGEILPEPKGDRGFGYDPIFYYPALHRTFAELDPREKDEVSHRGIAFRLLSKWLVESGSIEI